MIRAGRAQGPADHALCVQPGRGAGDGRGRGRHHRRAYGPDHRRRDRRDNGADARGLRGAHRRHRRGGARGAPRHHPAVPWRARSPSPRMRASSCALPRCHGFYGASSMERLPTETALTEQTRRFKQISRYRRAGNTSWPRPMRVPLSRRRSRLSGPPYGTSVRCSLASRVSRSSEIEDGDPPIRLVASARCNLMDGGSARERLLMLDDSRYRFSIQFRDARFSGRELCVDPGSHPVTNGDATFAAGRRLSTSGRKTPGNMSILSRTPSSRRDWRRWRTNCAVRPLPSGHTDAGKVRGRPRSSAPR